MNYQRPQLLDELAAQYVLGTLRGPARRRFERYCRSNVSALHAVRRWEDRLVDLLANVVPVAPSPLVWDRIKFRVRRDHALRPKRTFASLSNWRLAVAAGVAAIAIAFGVWTGFGPGSSQLVATIVDQQQAQLWSIEAPRNRDELRVSAADNLALDPARAYELWALPADGAAPVSLGLMPRERPRHSAVERRATSRVVALAARSQSASSRLAARRPARRPGRCCTSPTSSSPADSTLPQPDSVSRHCRAKPTYRTFLSAHKKTGALIVRRCSGPLDLRKQCGSSPRRRSSTSRWIDRMQQRCNSIARCVRCIRMQPRCVTAPQTAHESRRNSNHLELRS